MKSINHMLPDQKQELFNQRPCTWKNGTDRLYSIVLGLAGLFLFSSHLELANAAPAFADVLAIELVLGLFIIGVLLADPMFSEHYLLVMFSGSGSQLKNLIPFSSASAPTPAACAIPQVAHGCRAPPAAFC